MMANSSNIIIKKLKIAIYIIMALLLLTTVFSTTVISRNSYQNNQRITDSKITVSQTDSNTVIETTNEKTSSSSNSRITPSDDPELEETATTNNNPKTLQNNIYTFYVDANNGDDNNPGSKESPVKTIQKGMALLKSAPNPRKLIINEGIYTNYNAPNYDTNRLKVTNIYGEPNNPIIIEGKGNVLLEGWTEPCDPINNPKYNPNPIIGVLYSQYVLIKNLTAVGGGPHTLGLESSTNIDFINVSSTRSAGRGAFLCGSSPIPNNITFRNCEFGDTLNAGQSTHGFYATAGQWSSSHPPCKDIYFYDCEFWGNMRNGLQFNGKFENIGVERCVFRNNHVGGLTVMSAKNVYIANNIFYDNNRYPLILYIYYDYSWDPSIPGMIEEWYATHPPIQNVVIESNTMYMPSEPFWWDDYHYSDPSQGYSGILFSLSPEVRQYIPDYPDFTNIKVRNNVVGTHSGGFIIGSHMNINAEGNEFYNNIGFNYAGTGMWVANYGENPQGLSQYQNTHSNWKDNMEINPLLTAIVAKPTINGNTKHDYIQILPLYENDPDKDFHLLENSPAIDNSSSLYPSLDFDLNIRPFGEEADIGAYEYIPTTIGYSPEILLKIIQDQPVFLVSDKDGLNNLEKISILCKDIDTNQEIELFASKYMYLYKTVSTDYATYWVFTIKDQFVEMKFKEECTLKFTGEIGDKNGNTAENTITW